VATPPADAGRSKTILAAYAIVASIVAVLLVLLWMSAASGRSDAESERDLALSERDAAIETGIELDTELQATRDELAEATADGDNDQDETAAVDQSKELQVQVDDLTAEVERLTDENAALQAALDAATTPETTTPETTTPPTAAPPATTVAPATTAAPADTAPPAAEPLTPDEVGAWLASLYRRSVLGEGQVSCLGQTVLAELGNDRLATLLNDEDAGEDDALIEALRDAAASCGIDPSAIFG
jgi:TolA-binding protein